MGLRGRFERVRIRAGNVMRAKLAWLAPRNPVHVFHHIPKCGGISLVEVLDSWFITIFDYRDGWSTRYPEKTSLEDLRSCHCLCGHFETEGHYLHQRYPEVLDRKRYRLLTMVRHPLEVQMSLFRYEKLHGVQGFGSIEEQLERRTNYLGQCLQATPENYRDVLDRYDFVGVLEYGQFCIDLLARVLAKPPRKLPHLNKTDTEGVEQAEENQQGAEWLLALFEKNNRLDLEIYEYCLQRFRDQCRRYHIGLPSSSSRG